MIALHRRAVISSSNTLANMTLSSWSNSLGGGFTKDGLQQWAMLTNFGNESEMNGQQIRRRKRELSGLSNDSPYTDLFSQQISRHCCDYLLHQPSPSGLLGQAFFRSTNFSPEKCFLLAINYAFSFYPKQAVNMPEFQLNDQYLQWRVTMKAPMELICTWELERYGLKGCSMMAFDPSLCKAHHGNCINIPTKQLEGFKYRSAMKLHELYAKFLLDGMVKELELNAQQRR